MNLSIFSKQTGNLAEYILPAVLVGLVAVGGLTWMVQGDDGQQALMRVAQGESIVTRQSGETALVSKQYGQNPNNKAYSLTLANGQTIQLSGLPDNLALSIEVDGVNGTTTKILAALQQLIAKLEANNENSDTINALKALATSGYGLANKQLVIEQKTNSCGSDKTCVNSEGNQDPARLAAFSMTIGSCANEVNSLCNYQELSSLYGMRSLTNADWQALSHLYPGYEARVQTLGQFNYSKENVVIGPKLASFLSAFQSVEKNRSTSGEVNSLVNTLSQQIFGIARLAANGFATVGTSNNYDALKSGDLNPLGSNLDSTPDEYAQVVAGKFASQGIPSVFSQQTSARSDVICQTGQGRHENGQCQ